MNCRNLAILALVALWSSNLLTGCTDDQMAGGSNPFADATLGNSGGAPNGPPVVGGDDPVDVGVYDSGGYGNKPIGSNDAGGTVIPTIDKREIIFLHDTSAPLHLNENDEFPLLVKVIDFKSGGAATDVMLTWSIIDATGLNAPGDAELAQEASFTDQNGLSQVTFRANKASEVLYTVEVTADNAPPATTEISVSLVPKGAIKVNLKYDGGVVLNNVKVKVLPGGFLCGAFKPVNPPNDPLAEKTVVNVSASPEFDELPGSQKYTVVATAKGPNGNLAAAGCLDGVYVEQGKTSEVTLSLYVLVLNPAGIYDLTNVFDFTGAIPGQLGDIIDTIATLFYDPGQFLIDQIKNLVKQYIGGLITDAVFGLFGDKLADLITDWVLNDAPDWVQDIFTVGQDILQIVKKLELTGILKISKLSSDYYVQGVISFTGVVFTWKLGCDKNAPDYDECGKMPFSMDQFNSNGDFPMDLVGGSWTGTVVGYDKLAIDPHNIDLNYGKLILFVLNKIILKWLTGEDNLADAAAKIVGCDGIAKSLDNWVDYDDTYKACKNTVGLLVMPVESYLLGLSAQSWVTLKGSCTMFDEDDDLVVDRLDNGVWNGQINIQGAAGNNPFTGTWSAERQKAPGTP